MIEEPRDVDELTVLVEEMFDILESSGTDGLEAKLKELIQNVNTTHSEDLAMWLRASSAFRYECPSWGVLRVYAWYTIKDRHSIEVLNDIMYGIMNGADFREPK